MLSSGTSPYCIGYIRARNHQNDFQKQQDQCSWYPYRAYHGIRAKITLTVPWHATHKVSFVEVVCVARACKYLGSKTRRERPLRHALPLLPRFSLSRSVLSCAHFFQAPAAQAMLRQLFLLISWSFQEDIISAFPLAGEFTYFSVACRQSRTGSPQI